MRPANGGDQTAVARLAAGVQEATGDNVASASVGQGYTGEAASQAARDEEISLHVLKLSDANEALPYC